MTSVQNWTRRLDLDAGCNSAVQEVPGGLIGVLGLYAPDTGRKPRTLNL